MIFALILSLAHAGQWDEQCSSTSKSDASDAQGIGQQAVAQDKATAGSAAASAAKQGAMITPGADIQNSNIAAQQSNLSNALAQVKAKQADCDQVCKTQLSQAQAVTQQDPRYGEAQADVGKIPSTQQSQCDQPIQQVEQEIQSSLSQLPGQKNGTDSTKDASKGGGGAPSIPPIPSPTPAPTPDPSPAAAQTPLDCTQSASSVYTSCDDNFVAACTASATAAGCDTFAARYCNITGSAAASTTAASTTLIDGVQETENQTGEGTGTAYCRNAISANFCSNSANTNCVTCQNYRASQTAGCLANPTACATTTTAAQAASASCPNVEPVFSGTAVASAGTTVTSTSGTTVASTGAASSTGTFFATASIRRAVAAAASGLGFGTESVDSPSTATTSTTDAAAAKRSASGVRSTSAIGGLSTGVASTARPADVTSADGKNLFNISSGIYQTMCSSGRLNCKK